MPFSDIQIALAVSILSIYAGFNLVKLDDNSMQISGGFIFGLGVLLLIATIYLIVTEGF